MRLPSVCLLEILLISSVILLDLATNTVSQCTNCSYLGPASGHKKMTREPTALCVPVGKQMVTQCSLTCQIHKVQLGLQELWGFAVRWRIWLPPLFQSQGEDGMGSAGGIIQVVRSNSSVTIASLQQLCDVCFCLHFDFPTQVTAHRL